MKKITFNEAAQVLLDDALRRDMRSLIIDLTCLGLAIGAIGAYIL